MIFANIVLYSWPLVVLALFKKFSKSAALLVTIIAGYLFLPSVLSFDLPALPSLDKHTIPAISAFLIILMLGTQSTQDSLPGWLPQRPLPKALTLLLLAAAIFTVLTNGDALFYGPVVLPALRPWDALSIVLTALIMLLPFFLGRKFLASPKQQRLFLVALLGTGLAYSLLALYEIRMSPQLNAMVYGFFPHDWLQHIRNDGFRPIVFLTHGLRVSIFFTGCMLAAFGLARVTKGPLSIAALGAGAWLFITLFLSKSLGALAIGSILLPVVLFTTTRQQLLIASSLAAVVLLYPMLRGTNLIPVEQITAWAESISAERAQSFTFRLGNEELLLNRAAERPLFGWGGWGRNFVFGPDGSEISYVADGYWILVIGQGGWIKYLAEFGLLCLPAFVGFLRSKQFQLGMETSVLVIILVSSLIDLIPNATISPLTWLLAGSLWAGWNWGMLQNPRTPPHRPRPKHPGPPFHAMPNPRP